MFIRDKDNRSLFELHKQLQSLKLLLSRNISYREKLVATREKLERRLKQNEILEKGFRRTKKRLNQQNKNIVGVPFYDHDTAQRPELLNVYKMLKVPRSCQRQFIRNIYKIEEDEDEGGWRNRPMEEVVKSFKHRAHEIPFHLLGRNMTGLEVYRMWLKHHPREKNDEPFDIMPFYFKYRENWVQISVFTENKTPQQLYYQFHKVANQSKNKSTWKHYEDLRLVILVEYFGKGNWYEIQKILKTRSDVQIRERFCNILDPTLIVSKWTKDQQRRLVEVAEQYRYKWSRMARDRVVGHKTDNQIWRKFRDIICEQPMEERQKIVKDGNLLEKIQKYIRDKSNLSRKKKNNLSQTAVSLDSV